MPSHVDERAPTETTVTPRGPRRLVLRTFQSPGDVLMLSAAVRDLHAAQPGRFVTDVRTFTPAIWEHNPHVTPLDDHAPGVETIDVHYPLVHQSNQRPYHFIHGYSQFLEQRLSVPVPLTRFAGDVHLSAEEKRRPSPLEALGHRGPFWIVVAGGKHDFTAKWWDPAAWQQVVDHFQGRIQFAQCGETGHWHPRLKGVIDLVGRTNGREFILLMHHAEGVLCPVTYAMHLAAAVETRPGCPPRRACVVVAGGREPTHWEAYPHHQFLSTVGALPCCAEGGCWRSRCQLVGDGDEKDRHNVCERPVQITPELRIPECMRMISAADVIRRIELYYEGGSLRYCLGGGSRVEGQGPAERKNADNVQPAATTSAVRHSAGSQTTDARRISFSFIHGLGDAANFAHQVPLYVQRGYEVAVQCTADKAPLFLAAGATLTDQPAARHEFPHAPPLSSPPPDEPWAGNKGGFSLSHPPLPDIGPIGERWDEYCSVRLDLEPFVTDDIRREVDAFVARLGRPLVCLHTKGNTGPDLKNLDDETTIELYRGLLDQTDASLLLLDWDNRVPRLISHRVRHLTDDWRGLSLVELYYLLTQSDLLIGIDSGPLHFARFTRTPVLGLWPRHEPSIYALPRANSLHVTPATLRPLNKRRRIPFNIVECPGERLDGAFLARQAVRLLSPPVYLGAEHICQDVQLQQFVSWTRGLGLPESYFDRHRSFDLMLRHLAGRDRPVMLETGTIRAEEDWGGAGFSTYLFGAFLRAKGGVLHSVELNEDYVRFARRWTAVFGDAVQVHQSHSHRWLEQFAGTLDLAYLDSADIGTPGFQECCLKEAQLVLPKLRPGGMIAFDDTWWQRGQFQGKGPLALRWLLDQGWRIVYSGHQTVLAPPS